MNEMQTIDYYLKSAWQSVANKYNQIASRYGITQATGFLLINIHKEGTPVSQLASLLGTKSTSLSRMLNNLEDMGLIYRRVNQADKRSMNVFLTAEGVEKRKLAKKVILDFNAHLELHISREEQEVLINTLQKISLVASSYEPLQLNPIENE